MISMIALTVLAPSSPSYLAVNRLVIGKLSGSKWTAIQQGSEIPGKITFTRVGIGTTNGTCEVKGLTKSGPSDAMYLDSEEGAKVDGALFSGPVGTPRPLRTLDNTNAAYVQVVTKFLKKKGIKSAARITRVVMVDLDGDGKKEVVIEASNREGLLGDGMSGVKPGDYSLVLLRSESKGKAIEFPLAFDHAQRDGLNYENKILAIADFDHNGTMDVLLTSRYYEGESATLFGFKRMKVSKLVEMGDGV